MIKAIKEIAMYRNVVYPFQMNVAYARYIHCEKSRKYFDGSCQSHTGWKQNNGPAYFSVPNRYFVFTLYFVYLQYRKCFVGYIHLMQQNKLFESICVRSAAL